MSASRSSANVLPALPIALMVVGLGMLLIAGLAGTVLWLLTRRRPTLAASRMAASELHAGGEAAEA
ncbi:MAG: hypothetical protein R3F59_31770 [Myxococcota bacterium]